MTADPKFPATRHYDVLIGLARENGWVRGAEVGILKGKCLFTLLDHLPDLRMIGIDAWAYRPPSAEPGSETYRHQDLARCAADVKARAALYGDRCRILHMDHRRAAVQIEDASLDFVFLDADHTEPATAEAIWTWRRKVRPGGMVTGHDWEHWPSVRAALDAEVPGWTRHPESVWTWVVP